MPRGSRTLPVASVVVYSAVVALLVGLAVYSRGYSVNVGEVRLSGRSSPLPLFGQRKAYDVTLSFHGLALRIPAGRPLSVADGGKGRTAALDSVVSARDAAAILFDGGARLQLSRDGESSYRLTALSASHGQADVSLLMPFTLAHPDTAPADPASLSWTEAGIRYILSLPSGSRVDTGAGTIALAARTGTASDSLRLGASVAASRDPYAPWRARETSLTTAEALEREVSLFSDAAYSGWMQKRLSGDGKLWRGADGSFRFREEIGPALISEAIPRGAFPRARGLFADALASEMQARPDAAFSLSASPFVGNTREYVRRLAARSQTTTARVRRLISSADLSLLGPGDVPFLIDHAPADLTKELQSFLQARDTAGLSPGAALSVLEALLDYQTDGSGTEAGRARCVEMVEKRLLPRVRSTDKGVFLAADAGADVADGLRCGALFMRAGAGLDRPLLSAVGRSLVAGGLGLREDSGFLPARLELSQGLVTGKSGSLAPEDVFPTVVSRRLFPREIPLSRTLGPGAWVWTGADFTPGGSTPSGFTMAFSFPVGLSHSLVIQGVKPFTQLRLHGIPWRPDPEYFRYTDGYAYDSQAGTLYMKITHRLSREELSVTF